jgi:hypothetical protein
LDRQRSFVRMRSICSITLFFWWHLNLAESFHCVSSLGNLNRAISQTRKLTLWNAEDTYVASSLFPSRNGNSKDNSEGGNKSIDGDGGNQEAEKSKHQIIRSILQTMRENRPRLPVLVALVVGYNLGTRSSLRRKAATVASRSSPPPYVLSLVLTAVVLREIWRALPEWLKLQIPYLGRKYVNNKDNANGLQQQDQNDMTSVAVIASKLQTMVRKASEKLADPTSSESSNNNAIQVAFLALLQLSAQLKKQSADSRDARYAQGGILVPDPSTDVLLEDMDELFEFADWAYDEISPDNKPLKQALGEVGFVLLRHDKIALPGQVAHYVAISKERKTAVLGIKGTSNFEDMLTDCCGQAISYNLTAPFIQGGTTHLRCHEGVLLASTRLMEDVETLVEELLLPQNYKLIITGHSLGAGVASMLGVLLRSKLPQLRNDDGDLLKVVAFASPPVLDHDNALACASFCTTVVNNSDLIPRASLSNLVVFMEFIKAIFKRLEEKGAAPMDLATAAGFLRMLSQGDEGPMIMTVEEIKQELEAAFDRVELKDPDHLYVPGKVLHMYDLWSKEGYGEVEEEEISEEETKDGERISNTTRTAERAHVTDGTSESLRYIELDSRMMMDHMSPGYRSSIKALLSNPSPTTAAKA